MSTKKDRMCQAIQKHGEKLNTIFNTGINPIDLCKKLRRIEAAQDRANVNYCNGTIDSDQFDAQREKTLVAVKKVLGGKIPIYINSDPRGYALKIDDQIVRDQNIDIMTDWGGYGIVAPDLSEE
jgi:hypothetical protein